MTEIKVVREAGAEVIYPSKRKVESGRLGRCFIVCTPIIIKLFCILH